jgi:hypothetical protein
VSFDYAKSAATALRLLTKFGQPVTLRKQTAGAYDPATGTATITTSDTAGNAAILEFSDGERYQAGTTIQEGDKKALLNAAAVTPAPNDLLIAGSVTWTVLGVKTLAPAGTVVLYELHLRHG